MSSPGEPDGRLIRSRAALLDALHALDAHRDSVVVIGAQAIYLGTSGAAVAVAEATKDSDLAIDPRTLGEEPLIEAAMETVGFVLAPVKRQPGAWLSADGAPVDLMVPQDLAGAGSATTRGARIPPHHKRATRRARGLEAAMVDNSWLVVAALDPADDRRFEVRVASSPLVPRRPAQRWPVVPKLAWANPKRWRSRARHSQRTSSTPWSATQRWASGRLRLLTTVLTNPSSAAVTGRISQHSPSPKPWNCRSIGIRRHRPGWPEGTSHPEGRRFKSCPATNEPAVQGPAECRPSRARRHAPFDGRGPPTRNHRSVNVARAPRCAGLGTAPSSM